MDTSTQWEIPGADGETIFGDCHLPVSESGGDFGGERGEPKGVILIAHGFKGYKDYGMFPRIAQTCAEAGFIAHRFNFSHSGMTNNLDTFEQPELFEQDTWNKQVSDFRAVIEAVDRGELAGSGKPFVMFGHSRGGVSALLTAGRFADDGSMPQPSGVVTAASPSSSLNLTREMQDTLLEQGYLVSPSSRTSQDLRVGKAFLLEMLDDPKTHDLQTQVKKITCPVLVIHGDDDPTVPSENAGDLKEAAEQGELLIVEGGNHVFNTPNPLPPDMASSKHLETVLGALIRFSESRCCV
ncbi:MAG: alpha/beta fold hydrolase [Planctomycetota bacterium]|nr:alpha/beta fold hydrolase [Planctomycetota bacterium]